MSQLNVGLCWGCKYLNHKAHNPEWWFPASEHGLPSYPPDKQHWFCDCQECE